ncbi:MAG: hypothetical protein JW852_09950, partial [Spirochaetales bacterium]|nr:hypothetical protein [Spirochaetales bacterium]
MIVPMKKISLVTLSFEREEALRRLRETGVMHLNFGDGRSTDLEQLLRERSIIERALLAISGAKKEGERPDLDAGDAIGRITMIEEEKRTLNDELDFLIRERERVEPWGDFEPADVALLGEKGIPFNIYNLSSDEYEKVSDRDDLFVIRKEKAVVRVAVVNGEIDGALPVPLFERSLGAIDERIEEIRVCLSDLDSELTSFGPL